MSAPTVTIALADVLAERAGELQVLATALRAYQPDGPLPPHRVLSLSGQLLAQLNDLEAAVHHLRGWVTTT